MPVLFLYYIRTTEQPRNQNQRKNARKNGKRSTDEEKPAGNTNEAKTAKECAEKNASTAHGKTSRAGGMDAPTIKRFKPLSVPFLCPFWGKNKLFS